MLEAEVAKRVDIGFADEEGPWRLIAWLDQVQPPFDSQNGLFPSYGFKLLIDQIGSDVRLSTLDVVSKSIEAEHAHALRAIESLIEKTEESLETQIAEREDTLDAYFQGLRDMDEQPRPQKMLEEINGLVHLQLRLPN